MNKSKEEPRATGRTIRAIVIGLQHMLRGKNIVYVAATERSARDFYRRAKSWLEEAGWFEATGYRGAFKLDDTNSIIYFGGGSMRFTNMVNSVRITESAGMGAVVVDDHVVADAKAKAKHIEDRRKFLERIVGELYRYDIRTITVCQESSNITAITYDGATIVI